MKRLTIGLLLISSLVTYSASSNAFVCFMEDIAPIIGADYQHHWIKGRNGWDRHFPNSYPGANIYLGAKLTDYFGAELGWDWSAKKHRIWNITSGEIFLGQTAPNAFSGTTGVRREGGHFDIIGYVPVYDCLELMGTLGIGWVRPRIEMVVSTPGVTDTANIWQSAFLSVNGCSRAVWRVRAGAAYMITHMLGIRALVGAEGTKRMRIKGNTSFTNLGWEQQAYSNSVFVQIGGFIKF